MNTYDRRPPTPGVQDATRYPGIKPERWWHDLLWGLIPVTPVAAFLIPGVGAVQVLAFYCAAALLLYVIICLAGMGRALGLGQRASGPSPGRRPSGLEFRLHPPAPPTGTVVGQG